jgi:uncharacterized protein YdcH (DUF465 family)
MISSWCGGRPSVTGRFDRMSALTITHRAISTITNRLGGVPPYQGDPLMETYQEEIKAHLMATSEEFRTLVQEHSQLHHKLEELEGKGHLSEAEHLEEVQLKKQKLRLKDQINAMLARSRAQQVA